jgi:hypothetical protein
MKEKTAKKVWMIISIFAIGAMILFTFLPAFQ